ncbi:hypothetical protein ASPZODRAFT_13750 [Penicilliopsis zonata CBS 506.65]|uniref:Uncharacterized protein n=1 Tax=Penicilliopsis zonata CBS 506.65 TaxID=1073090 RepID=A0A1L9SP14_9EURO|nr:hypothetical protein ASPZODRAFT_13750 [Penicilliopsis zonata CBS 506.65]OJJ49009.1 hypothetical protein ASPZODRAFT_13750 [Penicilliopsis zonata CBS 506.65]
MEQWTIRRAVAVENPYLAWRPASQPVTQQSMAQSALGMIVRLPRQRRYSSLSPVTRPSSFLPPLVVPPADPGKLRPAQRRHYVMAGVLVILWSVRTEDSTVDGGPWTSE